MPSTHHAACRSEAHAFYAYSPTTGRNAISRRARRISQIRKEHAVAINLLRDSGVPLEQQRFTWRDLVQTPYNKLMDDAFTRVRVILMNGIESEALRFSHACARMNGPLQQALAQVRRVEQHQQTLVNWLN